MNRQSIVQRDSQAELLPIDLIIEILSRLPVKSIARCRCVSKLWSSTILRPEFTDLILTRSATNQPQLLLACETYTEVLFYSSHQNPDDESPSLAANYHMRFPWNNEFNYAEILLPVHGLICLKQGRKDDTVLVICNPSTGQSLTLPKVKTKRVTDVDNFFGYDPIGKQFKLLSMAWENKFSVECHVLTLGNGELLWRMIDCSIPHYTTSSRGICIGGVLYYLAVVKGLKNKDGIISFDIRSEKFKLIEEIEKDKRGMLVNYKGKLATLRSDILYDIVCERSRSFELCVLEDVETHEWSTHTYVIPPLSRGIVSRHGMHIIGVTRTGEIVLSSCNRSRPFYLIYYNLERKTIRKFEVQRIDMSKYHDVLTFIDHVEDVKIGGVFQTS